MNFLNRTFLCILFLSLHTAILAQTRESPKTELGFWLGASNPFPGSDTARVLNTDLGLGFFGRFQWKNPYWFTEIGGSVSNYQSRTEAGLTALPIFAAIDYKLQADLPVSVFLKGGGGTAYVVARPANVAKWNPMGYLGSEISFVAGKKIRIGLRLDYHHIFESVGTERAPELDYFYYSVYEDYRIFTERNPASYRLRDGQFFHFGLMLSFLL
ncbi:MAG: hypothetical protein AAF518_08600 [Spirochaetota bacterium]